MTRFQPSLPQGYRLVSFDSIGSTNDEAKRLARGGAPEGTLVWALEQTTGRGRRGRVWVSPRGNLYASLILRPDCPAARAAQLGFVSVLSLGDALRAQLPSAEGLSYKWPNDVLLHGRKLAGILLESETGAGGELAFVVIGVGVNLVSSPREVEFPATSAAEEGFVSPSPAALLEEFTKHFLSWLKRWRVAGFAPVRTAWLAGATPLGEAIRVRLESGTLCGRFVDIDHDGALLLETAGERRRISAGEIFPATPDLINAAGD
jgi:BirA family transcriptional regulator, biotin operon repressor / biotin---[acetyl-CoA-carboxylase] ligase